MAVSPVCLQVRHTTHKFYSMRVSIAVKNLSTRFPRQCSHAAQPFYDVANTCLLSLVCDHLCANTCLQHTFAVICLQTRVCNHMFTITCMQTHDCSHMYANTWLQLHVCNHIRAIRCLPHLVAGSSLKAPKLFSGSFKGFVSMHIDLNVLLKPSITHLTEPTAS